VQSSNYYRRTTKDVRAVWAAAGTLLRLRCTGPNIFVEANGGIVFPFTRERVLFQTESQVLDAFDVPSAAGTMALGFGVFAP